MKNKWSDAEAEKAKRGDGKKWGGDLALRAYTSRLIGGQKELVLHGGGNTSVKGVYKDVTGEERPALFVKASGNTLRNSCPYIDRFCIILNRVHLAFLMGQAH